MSGGQVAAAAGTEDTRVLGIRRLQECLEPLESRLIPAARGSKRPLFPHKGGRWTRELAAAADFSACDIGLLLHDLVVLDLDGEDRDHQDADAMLQWLHSSVGITAGANVQTRTSKGYHLIFRRTTELDVLQVFDGARCIALEPTHPLWVALPARVKAISQLNSHGRHVLPIDVKTVTASLCPVTGLHTAGVVMVPPSQGKEWVHPPWERGFAPVPECLLALLRFAACRRPRALQPRRGVNVAPDVEIAERRMLRQLFGFVEPLQLMDGRHFSAGNRSARHPCPCCHNKRVYGNSGVVVTQPHKNQNWSRTYHRHNDHHWVTVRNINANSCRPLTKACPPELRHLCTDTPVAMSGRPKSAEAGQTKLILCKTKDSSGEALSNMARLPARLHAQQPPPVALHTI